MDAHELLALREGHSLTHEGLAGLTGTTADRIASYEQGEPVSDGFARLVETMACYVRNNHGL